LSLDQAAVNRALANSVGSWSVDVTFVSAGIVVGVGAQLGALRLPRRQYALGVAARRGRIEVDVTEALRIPGAGPKIAAMLDAAARRLDGLAIRRRSNLLTIGHPWFRCERAASENGTLRVTLTARDGLQGLKRRRFRRTARDRWRRSRRCWKACLAPVEQPRSGTS
jgi:hypothetical protein